MFLIHFKLFYIWAKLSSAHGDLIRYDFFKRGKYLVDWVYIFGAFQIIDAVEYKVNHFLTHFCMLKAKKMYFPVEFHPALTRGSDLPPGRYIPVHYKYKRG